MKTDNKQQPANEEKNAETIGGYTFSSVHIGKLSQFYSIFDSLHTHKNNFK